jgi:DNA-binding MarR family transcriptional regulator
MKSGPSTIHRPARAAPTVREIVDELSPIMRGQRRAWVMRCQARGLSMLHLGVISLLDGEGSLPMSRLAELLDITLPNASGVVSRLEERGLVARQHAHDDRRVVLAHVTDAARDLLEELEVDRLANLTRLVEAMSDEERLAVHRSVLAFDAAKQRLDSKLSNTPSPVTSPPATTHVPLHDR